MHPNTANKNISIGYMLNKWLNHKKILSEKSRHYKNLARAGTLQKMNSVFTKTMLETPQGKMLERMVILFKQELRILLPHPDNKSYRTSMNELEEIITAAQKSLAN